VRCPSPSCNCQPGSATLAKKSPLSYLRAKKTLPPPVVNVPRLLGVAGDPGIA
jgi:hypothetical protein